jgi:hypothetical protein
MSTSIVHAQKDVIHIRWQPVYGASDYNLYVSDDGDEAGIEAQFDDTDLGDDGWFHYTFMPLGMRIVLHVTSIDAVSMEESDPIRSHSIIFT